MPMVLPACSLHCSTAIGTTQKQHRDCSSFHRPNASSRQSVGLVEEHGPPHCSQQLQLYLQKNNIENAIASLEQNLQLPSIDDLIPLFHECKEVREVGLAKRLHAGICNHGLDSQKAVGNHLVPMLVNCVSVCDATQVFYKLPHRNDYSWCSLIQGHNEGGDPQVALDMYDDMQRRSIKPSKFTFLGLLKACALLGDQDRGHGIHVEVTKQGYDLDICVSTALIDMYAKCGLLPEAQYSFDSLEEQDAVSWTALIIGYVEHGLAEKALEILEKMQGIGMLAIDVTYVCSLKACGIIGAVEKGQELHMEVVQRGFEQNLVIMNTLVDMYGSCGAFADAMGTLKNIAHPDVISWNTLIFTYAEHELDGEALTCFERMKLESIAPNEITYAFSLRACLSVGDVFTGQGLHEELVIEGFETDPFVVNSLVSMYAKLGYLVEAKELFNDLEFKDVVSWNALIAGYAEHGLLTEAIDLFEQMQLEGLPLCVRTLATTLNACTTLRLVDRGRAIHNEIAKDGFECNTVVGNVLVDLYAKCSLIVEANEIFHELPVRDVVSWNSLVTGYVENGLFEEALNCLDQMRVAGIPPNCVTFICTLKASGSIGCIQRVQGLHSEIFKVGYENDPLIGNILIDMYAKCGLFAEARAVFDALPHQNVVSWNTLITCYTEHDLDKEGLKCLDQMQEEGLPPNAVSFIASLKACANLSDTVKGQELHSDIVKVGAEKNPSVGNSLVDMNAKCGLLEEAQATFERLPVQDVIAWTVLISGYADHGLGDVALNLLERMQMEGVSPNAATYICSLSACESVGFIKRDPKMPVEITDKGSESNLRNATMYACSLKASGSPCCLDKGQEIHTGIVGKGFEDDSFIGNALVNFYASCGSFTEAQKVFIELLEQDVVSWNTLIDKYAEHGLYEKALNCFEQMELEGISPNVISFVCGLKACGSSGVIEKGRAMHDKIIKAGLESDCFVGNSLVDMYAKCGVLEEACETFEKLSVKDVVSWTALIAGYADHGHPEDALNYLEQLQLKGVPPNSITLLCSLKACGNLKDIEKGRELHSRIVAEGHIMSREEDTSFEHGGNLNNLLYEVAGFDTDRLVLTNCIIDMYGKCESLDDCQQVFDTMPKRDVVSWNTLIAAYSKQVRSEVVFCLFERMMEERIKPDDVTFLSILSLCKSARMVDKGLLYFQSMRDEYDLSPTIDHYNCIIDLLGSVGQLNEALMILNSMPFQPDMVSWFSLLSACCRFGNVELGRQAFHSVLKFDEKHAPSFALMYKIYTDAHMWEDARMIQSREERLESM